MPVSLFDDVRRSGFHSSIMTTFSVDPAFYDANLQFRLRSAGCQNNLLMADAGMLQQALEQLPEAFAQAGRKYLIVPVAAGGCFHPKIMIRYGKSKARMTLGSANATSAAWGSNRELISKLEWSDSADSADNAAHLGLMATAHDWLLGQLPAEPDGDLRYKLELLKAQSPWLAEAPRADGVVELSDGTRIGLFLSDPRMSQGIGTRFLAQVEGEVERLTVISPYWDDRLDALADLHDHLRKPSTHIFLALSDVAGARQSTFPTNISDRGVDPRFHPVDGSARHRFLHAKLILVQTPDHDYLLYGSANCTFPALGNAERVGGNCEAAIFRRLPRGTVEQALQLDYSRQIAREDILPPEERKPPPPREEPFDPGRIERKGDRLIWSCPPDVSPHGASMLASGTRLPVASPPGMRPHARVSQSISQVLTVVRVELADGKISRPIIVSDTEMLMASAPHPMADGLRRKLQAVLNGDADLISLARDAHLLFSADSGGSRGAAARRGGARSKSASSSMLAGEDFETPEEFRAALGLTADLHAHTLVHGDNPTLQLLLQIVLRGIVQLEGSESLEHADAEAAEALAAGEDQDDAGDDGEDGDGIAPKNAGRASATSTSSPPPVPERVIEQNRSALKRALDRFDSYLDTVSASDRKLDLDFVTRVLFMLNMMIHGCVQRYAVEGGDEQVLIPFSAIGTRNQDQGFLMRAARFVTRIWGRRFREGLMWRVAVDPEQDALPVPIVTLVILSRWVLAAILVEARAARGARSFSAVLEHEIPRLWTVTGAFGSPDAVQVETTVAQLARLLGMDPARAQEVETTMRSLGAHQLEPAR